MKLTGVELVPGGSAQSVALSFRDPRRLQPYNVKKIDGLDAEDIIARYYAAPGNSQAKFYNLSMQKREVGINIDLNPNHSTTSYSDLRDDMYRMISSSRTGLIDILFKNGETTVAKLSGHVTKLESNPFDQNQSVTLHVDCSAGETLLRAPSPLEIPVAGVSPASTVINDLLSTSPHGFDFTIAFLSAQPTFKISDASDASIFFEVTPTDGFQQYDLLSFSSEPADKFATLIRGVTPIFVADKITRSAWPIIFPGTNEFVCTTPTELEWVSISHRPTYWGV